MTLAIATQDKESGMAAQSEERPSQLKYSRAMDSVKKEAEDRNRDNAEEENESVERPSPDMAENPSADLVANENDDKREQSQSIIFIKVC